MICTVMVFPEINPNKVEHKISTKASWIQLFVRLILTKIPFYLNKVILVINQYRFYN